VNAPTTAPSKGKSKEEMLREEVRFWADLQQKYMQWALTVMISLQTAIFFVDATLSKPMSMLASSKRAKN
jgi:hypothetical protein